MTARRDKGSCRTIGERHRIVIYKTTGVYREQKADCACGRHKQPGLALAGPRASTGRATPARDATKGWTQIADGTAWMSLRAMQQGRQRAAAEEASRAPRCTCRSGGSGPRAVRARRGAPRGRGAMSSAARALDLEDGSISRGLSMHAKRPCLHLRRPRVLDGNAPAGGFARGEMIDAPQGRIDGKKQRWPCALVGRRLGWAISLCSTCSKRFDVLLQAPARGSLPVPTPTSTGAPLAARASTTCVSPCARWPTTPSPFGPTPSSPLRHDLCDLVTRAPEKASPLSASLQPQDALRLSAAWHAENHCTSLTTTTPSRTKKVRQPPWSRSRAPQRALGHPRYLTALTSPLRFNYGYWGFFASSRSLSLAAQPRATIPVRLAYVASRAPLGFPDVDIV